MKIKKILCYALTAILASQCAALPGFAADSTEPETVYLQSQTDNDEYGYLDYSFVDENGNPVEFEEGEQEGSSGINPLNSTSTELPTKYSLRDLGLVTDAKAQGNSHSCWAFSALGAMESNALVNGVKNPDFSESHLVWFAHNSATSDVDSPAYGDGTTLTDAYRKGGNWMLATAALSRWAGTVNEADYPFYPYDLSKMGGYSENERYNTSGGVILNSAEQLTSMQQIKSWIMDNGAVEASIYFNYNYLNMTDDVYSYCCNDSSLDVNHAVLIVGWDDYYSKSNFNSASTPTYPGAFLCKNSWGSTWGDDGYFWLSYFDATVCEIRGYTCVESDTYDNNYSYNGLGYGAALKTTSANGSQIANVFTAKGYETLSAVSTYTLKSDTYAEVFIYKNLPENYSKPNQGTRAYSSKKCLLTNSGYHTIKIDTPVELNPGEIFSVAIRFSNDSDLLYIVGEYNTGSSTTYSSKPRQSYFDLYGKNAAWTDSQNYGFKNTCVQAFTVCNHQPYDEITNSTCETGGTVATCCLQCGEVLSSYETVASGHTFGEWNMIKSATKSSEGERARSCKTCGYTETVSIPRLPQSSTRTVRVNEFFEVLKMWFDNFIARIAERYKEQNYRSY